MSWDWQFALEIVPTMVRALRTTVVIALAASAVALLLGLVIALVSTLIPHRWNVVLRWAVDFIRGTPMLVQLYFLFFVLPLYGVSLSALTVAIAGLGIHFAAYTSEVYRAGIEGIDRGQWEAASVLSMSVGQTWWNIVIPQALRDSLPALGNYVNMMFKNSAFAAVIGVPELLAAARKIGSDTFQYLEPMTIAALLFLSISYMGTVGISRMENRLRQARV